MGWADRLRALSRRGELLGALREGLALFEACEGGAGGVSRGERGSLREKVSLISLHLPTSPYISLHLPTSPYISLYLPLSPYISLCLVCGARLAA